MHLLPPNGKIFLHQAPAKHSSKILNSATCVIFGRQELTPEGEHVRFIGMDVVKDPKGVCCCSQTGRVYVADTFGGSDAQLSRLPCVRVFAPDDAGGDDAGYGGGEGEGDVGGGLKQVAVFGPALYLDSGILFGTISTLGGLSCTGGSLAISHGWKQGGPSMLDRKVKDVVSLLNASTGVWMKAMSEKSETRTHSPSLNISCPSSILLPLTTGKGKDRQSRGNQGFDNDERIFDQL